ncbi:SAM-dependent methyltransferase [Chryseobacterium sp. Alg-005]|uniref:tRNA (N6-threonylcarbamoyladenosine(37)-N6)-methyltransferase TrmO n=1 Tax=Chryseobacterium sp. Alg-005 TaxID=3159516 RepID=UPI0035556C40
MKIELSPIGFVRNSRSKPIDDDWNEIISEIELAEDIPDEALSGLSDFSHLEIIFYFNLVNPEKIVFSGYPRGNTEYPKMGIFGQRKKDRPNQIGLTTVELLKCENRKITVKHLDAINGTPILDIKPVFREFQVKSEIKQPDWVGDLMKNYW